MKVKNKGVQAPRNHVVVALGLRGASGSGAHEKSKKSKRQHDRVTLQRSIQRNIFD